MNLAMHLTFVCYMRFVCVMHRAEMKNTFLQKRCYAVFDSEY